MARSMVACPFQKRKIDAASRATESPAQGIQAREVDRNVRAPPRIGTSINLVIPLDKLGGCVRQVNCIYYVLRQIALWRLNNSSEQFSATERGSDSNVIGAPPRDAPQ